jgi:uncharacterized protein (DUF1778 family)
MAERNDNTIPIQTRVTPEQKAAIEARAALDGLSLSAYMRVTILRDVRKVGAE